MSATGAKVGLAERHHSTFPVRAARLSLRFKTLSATTVRTVLKTAATPRADQYHPPQPFAVAAAVPTRTATSARFLHRKSGAAQYRVATERLPLAPPSPSRAHLRCPTGRGVRAYSVTLHGRAAVLDRATRFSTGPAERSPPGLTLNGANPQRNPGRRPPVRRSVSRSR